MIDRALFVVVLVMSGLAYAQDIAKPLPPPAVPPEKAARPLKSVPLVNAGFESTAAGKLGGPEGWLAVQHAGPPSYAFTLDLEHKQSGKQSLKIENIGPEPFGSIFQTVDAAPYRGQTLRFAAWVRTEGATGNRYGSGAGLALQSMRGGYVVDAAQMRNNAIHGATGWARYEVALKVSGQADQIEVGLHLFGPGIAWLDDTALDVIEPPPATARP